MALSLTACSDDMLKEAVGGDTAPNTGEMVIFRAGTTDNTTRAEARTYYMPKDSRFVCRMYYKTQDGMEEYDVSNPTDAWLMVNNETGNSVYWNKYYASVADDGLDKYGNDDNSTFFYWMNRRPHAFLAWTDFNKMGDDDFKYSSDLNSGMLKFSPYDAIITTNDISNVWMDTGYKIYGLKDEEGADKSFSSWAELKEYVEANGENDEFKALQNSFSGTENFANSTYYYEYGWSCKYFIDTNAQEEKPDDTHKTSAWIKYYMYYDKFEYERQKNADGTYTEIEEKEKDSDIIIFLKDALGNYIAAAEYDNDDIEHENPHYYKTDINGNIRYDEERPKYTFYMKRTSELKTGMAGHSNHRANIFNLTRTESMATMKDQPDILQALTTQAPTSATLQANRVDLYFKHQFSQIQVNLKNSEDNSVKIEPGQIEKVELLGVTEQGYVFTELQSNGTVRATSYKDVVATDYTDAELKANPYGTSLRMFDRTLTEDETATTGAIKSYEAIAFGMLQAIRITWHETEGEGSTKHISTYRVPEKNEQNQPLRSLQSGVKYIWNIELRRGTLAVIRTEIIPWELNQEHYAVNGTIVKQQANQ